MHHFEHRSHRYNAASEPRIAVTWLERTPPFPWTSEMFESSTCRSPHSLRSWRTASTIRSNPYIHNREAKTQHFPPSRYRAVAVVGSVMY